MNKPTITVINASGESKTFSISDIGTKQAYKETCKHLDKGLNKKLFNEFTNQLKPTNEIKKEKKES